MSASDHIDGSAGAPAHHEQDRTAEQGRIPVQERTADAGPARPDDGDGDPGPPGSGADEPSADARPTRRQRLVRSIPTIVAVLAGVVGVVGGVVALIPHPAPPSPFAESAFSEAFNSPLADPQEADRYYASWIAPDRDPDPDDSWTTEVDTTSGLFRLTNRTDRNAVRYHWVSVRDDATGTALDAADRPVTVDFRIPERGTPASSAGLLYRCAGEPRAYYAFLVSSDGTYSFAVRRPTGGGLSYQLTEVSDRIRPDGWNRIGIVAHGDRLDLYLNDTRVRTVPAVELTDGQSGVIATSTGVFEFDNFQLYR
ncbi:family 16 glycoside hydrolase [Micromonospora matsumotoense]|uniref:family 16 glycoside hydrolase n=1 Tax=Micromonospora matsumotoense TaxID=121616 RepID=UPI003D9198A2